MSLASQVALVTGASRGIGKAIAIELARSGADVVVNYSSNRDKAEEVVKEITSLGRRSFSIQARVENGKEAKAMVQEVHQKLGKIDILVNNAGITEDGFLMTMSEDRWDKVISTNLKGTYNCSKQAASKMFRQKSGTIINIASVSGVIGLAGQTNYSASKAGIIGLTKAMAKELASFGIRVNAIAPGFIVTDMLGKLSEDMLKENEKHIPAGRLGTPEEVAKAVGFLASPGASYIYGQVIVIDGGMVM